MCKEKYPHYPLTQNIKINTIYIDTLSGINRPS